MGLIRTYVRNRPLLRLGILSLRPGICPRSGADSDISSQ
jgi:hypothetical protein